MQHTKNIYLVSYDNRKDLWLQNNHFVKTRKHLAQLIKPRNYELPISFLRFLPSFLRNNHDMHTYDIMYLRFGHNFSSKFRILFFQF